MCGKKSLVRLGGKIKWTHLTGKFCWKIVLNNWIDDLVEKIYDQLSGKILWENVVEQSSAQIECKIWWKFTNLVEQLVDNLVTKLGVQLSWTFICKIRWKLGAKFGWKN